MKYRDGIRSLNLNSKSSKKIRRSCFSTETENHMDLRYEAIYNAVMGDRDAIEEVLKYYDASRMKEDNKLLKLLHSPKLMLHELRIGKRQI